MPTGAQPQEAQSARTLLARQGGRVVPRAEVRTIKAAPPPPSPLPPHALAEANPRHAFGPGSDTTSCWCAWASASASPRAEYITLDSEDLVTCPRRHILINPATPTRRRSPEDAAQLRHTSSPTSPGSTSPAAKSHQLPSSTTRRLGLFPARSLIRVAEEIGEVLGWLGRFGMRKARGDDVTG